MSSLMVLQHAATVLSGPACTVLVGCEEQAFTVHEKLISDSSAFFKAALSGPWEEASTHTVKLPEEEPKIFSLYIHWLYCQIIPVLADRTHLDKMTGTKLVSAEKIINNDEYTLLFKACVLADKMLDARFHDAVIHAVLEKIDALDVSGRRRPPGWTSVVWLFNNAQISSPICRLIMDEYVKEARGSWVDSPDTPTALPMAFFRTLAQRLMDKRGILPEWTIKADKYLYANSSLKRKRSSSL